MNQNKPGIVILGNGYDIFHGNKTTYKDFVESLDEDTNVWNIYFKNILHIQNWIDIENEFGKIIESYINFKNEYSTFYITFPYNKNYEQLIHFFGFTVNVYNEPYEETYIQHNKTKSKQKLKCDFDSIIISKYYENHKIPNLVVDNSIINFNDIDKIIIEDFNAIKKKLQLHIQNNVSTNESDYKNSSIQKVISNYDNVIVLNFNYTNTLQFYNKNITNIFVHGSIEDKIVLGTNNTLTETFSFFRKDIQALSSDINYKNKFVSALGIIEPSLVDLIVLGHSFDLNDYDKFNFIYKVAHNKYFHIDSLNLFYYNEEDKIKRLYNIKEFFTNYLEDTTANYNLDYNNLDYDMKGNPIFFKNNYKKTGEFFFELYEMKNKINLIKLENN